MVKQSNNPFKMWGSYVGAVIGLYFGGFFIELVSTENIDVFETALKWFNNVIPTTVIPLTIGGAILGFLIGWGIHLLFRRFSK